MGIQIKYILFLGLFSVFTLSNCTRKVTDANIDSTSIDNVNVYPNKTSPQIDSTSIDDNENIYLDKTTPEYEQLLSVLSKDYYVDTSFLYTVGRLL